MWLLTTFIAALFVTAMGLFASKKYKLDILSVMLWGAASMILVDHVLGYGGGEFLEMQTEGLIANGVVLGVTMLVPVFAVWEIMVLMAKIRGTSGWSKPRR